MWAVEAVVGRKGVRCVSFVDGVGLGCLMSLCS